MHLNSERLTIRELSLDDANFIVSLLNSEAFLVNIGDRNVHTKTHAEEKIKNQYTDDYPEYGLFAVELTDSAVLIGTVSYLKRDYLEQDDLGYAFLPEFWGKGYALEAARAVVEYKLEQGVQHIWGVVNADNLASIKLLEKLNFKTTGLVLMEGDEEPILKMELIPNTK